MYKEQPIDSGFPGIAFATLPTTGETIAIRYGERVYLRVNTSLTAEELNEIYGVTQAQAKAMLASLMSDWETPPLDQESHHSLIRST